MNPAGARVVVTGGAGFIGSELTRQLCAAGAGVCVLDNLVNGSEENLAGIESPKLRSIRGDVRDAGLLGEVLRDCDMLFHLACLGVRHSLGHPRENLEVNETGTLRVLEAALAAGVRRMVHVSTSEVYGSAQSVPMTEDHPTRPTTVYGASKLAGESYARAFHLCHGLPVAIVRPFNSFGPRSHAAGEAGEVIPRFIVNLRNGMPLPVFGDGNQTRDFTFVSDTARGILLAGLAESATGRAINLGSGRETSLVQLAHALANACGLPAPKFVHLAERPGDVRQMVADSSTAREVLGWEPRINFEDGLRATVEWFESTAAGLAEVPTQNWRNQPSRTEGALA